MCSALFFLEMVKGFTYIHFAGAYWKRPAPTGGETLEWLSSRMMYDCSAWLPNKSHIVGFNLDLDFQLPPTDSWEWRRMIRSLWVHQHLMLSKFSKACVLPTAMLTCGSTREQRRHRAPRRLSHVACIVVWRPISVRKFTLFGLHIYTNDCTFIFMELKVKQIKHEKGFG